MKILEIHTCNSERSASLRSHVCSQHRSALGSVGIAAVLSTALPVWMPGAGEGVGEGGTLLPKASRQELEHAQEKWKICNFSGKEGI